MNDTPQRGSKEEHWWLAGARAEAALRTQGMTDDVKQIHSCVETLGKQGKSADHVTQWIARVFTAGWPLRRRIKLAWKLVRG